MNPSTAVCRISIRYDQPLVQVQDLLVDSLPSLQGNICGALSAPQYKGVDKLGDSGVVLLIAVSVLEQDKLQAEWDLKRELKLLFDRNDIDIPFPQLTVSTLSTDKDV